MKKLILLLIITSFLSCSKQPSRQELLTASQNIKQYQPIHILQPFNDSIFPADMIAPHIKWENDEATNWAILINDGNENHIFTPLNKNWTFDKQLWEELKTSKPPILLSIFGLKKNKIISAGQIHFTISQDSVNAPLFFRSVPLPFSYALRHLEEIKWQMGSVSQESPKTVMENLPLCGNCHSFTADGSTLAMDVDYANDKGSYVISDIENETILTPKKIITWSSFDPKHPKKTFGLLSQISPDGRHVLSTVHDRSIFVPVDNLEYSQLFFPIKGIIGVYDRKTEKFNALNGADNPTFVQSNPSWSPDGETIYFTKTSAYHLKEAENSDNVILPAELAGEFIRREKEFKYDIYTIPFNNSRGGKPVPLKGASQNGKSNYFPKISPDGKWVVFCQADNFMLLQPDSKLYIMPANGGEPRLMNCNTDNMNSWHSWSPNGKWLAFASKVDGAYTKILLTHIDDNGNDSPPVVLDHLSCSERAINIPEFINTNFDNLDKITDQFTNQSHYYLTIGRNKIGEQKLEEALVAFENALKIDPNFAQVYLFKGLTEIKLQRFSEAINSFQKGYAIDPKNTELAINLGTTLFKTEQYDKAIKVFSQAIRNDPQNGVLHLNRALAFGKTEKFQKAIYDFTKAINLEQNNAEVFYQRGFYHALLKQYKPAAQDFQQAFNLNPKNGQAVEKLGMALYYLKNYKDALTAYDKALQFNESADIYSFRGLCKIALKDYNGAITEYDMALALAPNTPTNLMQRGVLKIRIGQKQRACEDFLKAKQLGFKPAEKEYNKYCSK